jgi:CelD/BcsL family acetyltransferase involved in cellulose biosynthesis
MATPTARSDVAGQGLLAAPTARARKQTFVVETFIGADDALAALEAVEAHCTGDAFRSLDWLTALYEELAPHRGAEPRVVVVSDARTNAVALVLPLVVQSLKGLRIARFADLGVSDYAAPMIGPGFPSTDRGVRRLIRLVQRRLDGIDVLHFERVAADGSENLTRLFLARRRVAAQHSGFVCEIKDSVDAFLASRGKKFRKEVERSTRVWRREAKASFRLCKTAEDCVHVYAVLEEQQSSRHAGSQSPYILNETAYRSFYERIAVDGSQSDLARLFALEAGGDIAATLFGIVKGDTFTLLRITTAGDDVSHFSPGRLVVVEAMRLLHAQGITRFDMGIGDYPFKRTFGAAEVKLSDFVAARTLKGLPHALWLRTKARWRRNALLRCAYSGFSGRSHSDH